MNRYFNLYIARNGACNTHLKTFPSPLATGEANAKIIVRSMGLTGNFILINEFDAQLIEFSI